MQKTIFGICICLILISIIFTLIPNKSMEPTIKFILNIFLISVIIIPIINAIKNFNISQYSDILKNNEINQKNLEEKILKTNKKNLKNALKIVFEQNGYKDLDISIEINKENKVTKIVVNIPKDRDYDENQIKNIVKNQTGISPEIDYF